MTDDQRRPRPPVVGMVGAGQLARMTCQAAISLGIGFRVLAETPADSAALVCADVVTGDYTDSGALLAFARGCDVVTFDHEHVPGGHLAELEKAAAGQTSAAVRPGAAALRYTQDKLAMRERLGALGVPCPRYAPVTDLAGVRARAEEWGWPVVLKAVTGGYDGRGVWVCGTPEEAAAVLAHPVAVFAEEHVAFRAELAALVARSPYGQAAAYPVVQTVQRGGVCHEVLAPAPGLPPGQAIQAQRMALALAAELGVTGLLAVELFAAEGGGLLVNELAMRPHNSGHWTIEGARTSQFEQHLRAVLDLPLGDPRMAAPQAVMANVFGASSPDIFSRYEHVMAADPGVKVHLYGKQVRAGRKIGHVTVLGGDVAGLRERAARAASYLATGNEESA
ncbi:MAG TPA: 5-(carboxyamino)imidazole ribonucleotide synthase [Streptosporangiaceae bacterium]